MTEHLARRAGAAAFQRDLDVWTREGLAWQQDGGCDWHVRDIEADLGLDAPLDAAQREQYVNAWRVAYLAAQTVAGAWDCDGDDHCWWGRCESCGAVGDDPDEDTCCDEPDWISRCEDCGEVRA